MSRHKGRTPPPRAGKGLYGVHIADDDYVRCDGQAIPLDEWRRRYLGAVTVDVVYGDWPPATGET